jgi:hypothetical protein
MSMKITSQVRLPGSGPTAHRGVWNWIRSLFRRQNPSVPVRSVTMQEDDLDHLGALHRNTGTHSRR